MTLRQMSHEDLLQAFDPDCHASLERTLQLPGTDGLIVFENVDLSSSQIGARTAVAYGPERTIKSLDDAKGRHLNDLPSQRQYPTAYYAKA